MVPWPICLQWPKLIFGIKSRRQQWQSLIALTITSTKLCEEARNPSLRFYHDKQAYSCELVMSELANIINDSDLLCACQSVHQLKGFNFRQNGDKNSLGRTVEVFCFVFLFDQADFVLLCCCFWKFSFIRSFTFGFSFGQDSRVRDLYDRDTNVAHIAQGAVQQTMPWKSFAFQSSTKTNVISCKIYISFQRALGKQTNKQTNKQIISKSAPE